MGELWDVFWMGSGTRLQGTTLKQTCTEGQHRGPVHDREMLMLVA